uniref:Ankyrin repeat and SOCS box-containing 16 n=2 Tax=Nothobranchius kuhntae TaxID=321403 RepID=A0A1A8HZC0_NOTKU
MIRKQRRGPRKIRKLPTKAPSVEQTLPDVTAEVPGLPDEYMRALHAACVHGQLATVQVLVESRPWWVNISDSQGRQPLHMALSCHASPNTHTCLRYLLAHEADVNATTDSGQTPLHLAASEGLLECVEILVKAGADVLAKDSMGLTPLDTARILCHRKVARYLKTSLWQANKKRELEERILAQALYRDLMNKVKQTDPSRQALIDEKVADWAKKKGLPLLKDLTPRVQASKYHSQCLLPDQSAFKPKQTKNHPGDPLKNKSSFTKQLAASYSSPWSIFIGHQPEEPLTEPDLRDSVTLWMDRRNQKLQYVTKWEGSPRPTPNLPLDVVERVLFPRAFPSRIATPQCFEPLNIDEVQHRRCPTSKMSSEMEHLPLDGGGHAPG